MNYDIVRIKTLADNAKIGIGISSEYENKKDNYSDFREKMLAETINNLFSEEFHVLNVEHLPDGDYPRNLFVEIYTAAHIVPEGQPTPISSGKHLLEYRKDSEEHIFNDK